MADLKRICGVDDEDLADMIRELRAYDPKPGCRFRRRGVGERHARRLRPPHARAAMRSSSTARRCRALLVNRRYYQELKTGPQDKASRAWLSECLASANWLVKALDQRARTIVKVVSEIVEAAAGLLRPAASAAMKPLTLREVAEAIEMHESTVSRVTSNKYLLCDRGLFELKYFFGSGVASTEARAKARRPKRSRPRSASHRRRDRDPQRRCDRRPAQAARLRLSPAAPSSNIARRWGSARRSSAAGSARCRRG